MFFKFHDVKWRFLTVFCIFPIYLIDGSLVMEKKEDNAKPNIVFILTDDQDQILGGLTPMKHVKTLLKDQGMTFLNTFTPTPLCCPSRSSILTGRYQHNHGVLNNSISGNCGSLTWQGDQENFTLAVAAKNNGYETFFAGKYLNQYGKQEVGGFQHIPKGWDNWYGLVGNSKYYNYTLSNNGNKEDHGDNYEKDYLTDLIANKSVDFINNRGLFDDPFFMMISTPACHSPWNVAPKYENMYPNNTAPTDGCYNKKGDDKHWLLRQPTNPMASDSISYLNDVYRKRWRTLLSVDELIERVYTALKTNKLLDNTYIIFTSDNGYHLGQFSLPIDKRQLYEFDIRVPLIVRGPGVPKNVSRSEIVVNIDIAPTIADISSGGKGQFPKSMDGASFLPLLNMNKAPTWRTDFLVEYQGEGKDTAYPGCPKTTAGVSQCFPGCVCEDAYNNTYSCVRELDLKQHTDLMYCEFTDSETFVELYNHTVDPYQLKNIKSTVNPQVLVGMNHRLITLGICTGQSCRAPKIGRRRPKSSSLFIRYLTVIKSLFVNLMTIWPGSILF